MIYSFLFVFFSFLFKLISFKQSRRPLLVTNAKTLFVRHGKTNQIGHIIHFVADVSKPGRNHRGALQLYNRSNTFEYQKIVQNAPGSHLQNFLVRDVKKRGMTMSDMSLGGGDESSLFFIHSNVFFLYSIYLLFKPVFCFID